MSARVKNETHAYFKSVAEAYGTTIAKILDSLAGVQVDDTGALEAFFGEYDEQD